jgi:2-keto-myo-inositol isomerase
MPDLPPLCLNRIARPQLPLAEFLRFTADLGIKYVELRNDLDEVGLLDGLPANSLQAAFSETGIKALTINALYPFEAAKALDRNLEKLKGLITEAKRVECPYIVLCPLNEGGDPRNPAQRADQLVAALNAYGPLFQEAHMTGLIEPLGFSVSALRTKNAALTGIEKCNFPGVYKLLHDTFHHYLSGETDFFPEETALIHVSGVLPGKERPDITDADRVLVTENDILENRGQVATLLKSGSTAPFSFEPFSPQVQNLPSQDLQTQLKQSIEYLFS